MQIDMGLGFFFVMKFLSWNIRGANNPAKRRNLKDVIAKSLPIWIGLQKSKLREVGEFSILGDGWRDSLLLELFFV